MVHTFTPQNKMSKLAVAVEILVLGCLIAILYADAIGSMVSKWSMEDYNHGYLIPFLVLYLIWEKRKDLAKLPSLPSWMGFFTIIFGLGLFWLGELGGEFFTLYMSLWFVLVGVCWAYLGWSKLKILTFPFLITLTAFPLPKFLYTKFSWQLKLISSQLGVAIMQGLGMSAFREGNVIDLGFTQLQVVDACNGLRYMIPLIVLGMLLAYFFKATLWKRIILVASTIPLSIITNSLRIALTGIVYEQWGPALAEGFFHEFSGWFIFMASLAALFLEMWVLNGFKGLGFRTQSSEVGGHPAEIRSVETLSTLRGKEVGNQRRWPKAQFWVAVILLGGTLGFSHGVEFREKVPISKSFELFPLQVGEWIGTREIMEKRFIDALDLTDYVIVNYRNPSGKQVNFYVAYYESQRKGESIHTPETCLPGSGWLFRKAGRVDVAMGDKMAGGFPVNRAVMQKGEQKQVVYYWFSQRGRILTNAYELKLYAFWDALTKQRTDGALVRLITPIYEGEKPARRSRDCKSLWVTSCRCWKNIFLDGSLHEKR
jgi:exosortase D (VPLPA-CTERM-specific)